jgi:hypothetical protein
MATFGTFVAGQVLTAAELNATATWTTFTPSWSNLTVGTGGSAENTGRYLIFNKLMFVRTRTVLGSSGFSVGADPRMTLPASVSTVSAISGGGGTSGFTDAGTIDIGGTIQTITTTAVRPVYFQASGSFTTFNTASATNPWTWAAGDRISMDFWIQLA